MTEPPLEVAGRALARSLRHHWKLFLVEGIVLLLLGLAALVLPLFAGLAITILLGWVFLTSGVVDLFVAFIIIIGLPGAVAWALGLIVGINLLFGGSAMVTMALAARNHDLG